MFLFIMFSVFPQTVIQWRRGNWITLKMRKLMKTRARDQEHVHSPTLRSESCEGLDDLRCHDNGSFVGSQGSEESAPNSLNGDTLSPKRSSSEYHLSYMKLSESNHSSQERPETSHSINRKPFIPTSPGQESENRIAWSSQVKGSNSPQNPLIRKLINFCSPSPWRHRALQEEFSYSN